LSAFKFKPVKLKQFSLEEQRQIVFKDITTDKVSHVTELDSLISPNYQSVIGFFAQSIMKQLRLVGGFEVLFGKIKEFVLNYLFGQTVDLNSLNTLRNLSETEATRIIIEGFIKAVNDLTVVDKGEAEIKNYIKISQVRPIIMNQQEFLVPQKSIFNRIAGDSHLELEFAAFLEKCDDIISYIKNYLAIQFKIDYQTAEGDISNYYPDFIVKKTNRGIYIIETKGLKDLDVPLKLKRLNQWCKDINKTQKEVKFAWLFVEQEKFNKYRPNSFEDLIKTFAK